MITKYRLDKLFGPSGSSAGVLLLIVGVVSIFFTYIGLFFIILGAFAGLSVSTTRINHDNNTIMFSNDIFGFIHTGSWISIEPDMKIGIRTVTKGWRSNSLSNRNLDTFQKDLRIILFDKNHKEILPVMKIKSRETGQKELEQLSGRLHLEMI